MTDTFDPTAWGAVPSEGISTPLKVTVTPKGSQAENPESWGAVPVPTVGMGHAAAISGQQGLLAGFADELAGLGAASGLPVGTPPIISAPLGAIRRLAGSPGANEAYQAARNQFRATLAAAQAQHPYATTAGEIGGSLASAAAPIGALGAGATLGGTAIRGALGGAALGALQGAGNAPEMSDVPREAAMGSAVGGAVGAALPGVAAGARRIVSPFVSRSQPVSGRVAKSVETLKNEGVTDLTAGQQTGNKALKYFESEHGGRAVQEVYDNQQQQFTKAALSRIGIDSPIADNAAMQKAATDIGAKFDAFGANNDITGSANTRGLVGDLLKDFYVYKNLGGQAPIIGNTLTRVANTIRDNGGVLPGKAYQFIRSDLLRNQRGTGDAGVKNAIGDMIDSLDNAMQKSASSDQVAAFKEARRQYANLIVLEKAVAQSGENITPSALRNAVKSGDIRRFVQGRTDLGDLANAGKEILRPMPESGTATRSAARSASKFISNVGTNVLFGAGGSYAGSEEGPTGALAGGALGLAAPSIGARIALSKLGRRYLTNSLVTGSPGVPILSLVQPARALLQDRYNEQGKQR